MIWRSVRCSCSANGGICGISLQETDGSFSWTHSVGCSGYLCMRNSPLLCVCLWWSTCWRIWNGNGSAGSDGGLGSAGLQLTSSDRGPLPWPCVNDPHVLISNYDLSPQFIWPMFKMSVCPFPSNRSKQLFPVGTSLRSVKISQGISQGILAKSVRTSLSSAHGA